ncbi:uncharacterized protein MELLADRAFT_104853 [Melampsora larici-populina 98AG31]|uniref:Alpha-type protein kinase domain-containing protein n=1 Tax=Melampsora larici-populina (strain 98AG31 / pathotype 3-4-7) TaxID=747676 RepID=F4RFZ0_MELLP|nr:uncharacterized protein MELLADRAFT_104853 [Melampsora larici-populina 98AG31]EGG08456.1 hypothetical protein MELLADRAFT_104853 [Melampsora larici-populina 98AG31]
MIPNPNLDSPLCCCCGEDYPGRERTQAICDPCQWSKDNPNKVNKPNLRSSRLSCVVDAKNVQRHSHLSVPLNSATPASAHFGTQVEHSVQRAIAQANELQSRQRQLQINNHRKPVVPYPPSSEARAIARSKLNKRSESKKSKTTGFIKINIAYIMDNELVETQLSGSTFDYDFSEPDWMLDLTKKACDYFRDDHPTFPSPQQVVEHGLESLPPYYKEWYYLGELGGRNSLPNRITENYLCSKLTSGRGCEKFVLIYNSHQYKTATGKENIEDDEDELLDLPPAPFDHPQSMTLRSHSVKKNRVRKSSVHLSSDSEASEALHGSINSNSIDDHDYTPRPTRALNVKRPNSNMQSIETQTSPPSVQSKATQTSNQVIDERVDISRVIDVAERVDISSCVPLHQVMNKLVDDHPGGEVGFSDLGIMRSLGRGTLPIVTKARNRLSPSWKSGSMLTIITKGLDSNNINRLAIERLAFENSEVVYSVNCSAFIGSGAFMNCYEEKVLIDGRAQEMVAKQDLDANMTLESYQALAQRYLEAERSINMFKMAIEANSGNIPYDLVKNFIVHRGHTDDPAPKDIYLFEEKIEGKFVKFFGNLFFNIEEEKENKIIYQIMHTLSHKTYHDNHGRWMIADLQGNEEGLLTDVAIIDEEYPWTMGNTSRIGLIGFRLTAKCNFLCSKLGLPHPHGARYPTVVNGVVVEGTESEFPVLDSDAERSWELHYNIDLYKLKSYKEL